MSAKRQLDPLPDNRDGYWEGSEVHGGLVPQTVNPTSPHYFVHKSGREAQCTHCDWGFALDPGDKIVDGHLYDRHGKRVI